MARPRKKSVTIECTDACKRLRWSARKSANPKLEAQKIHLAIYEIFKRAMALAPNDKKIAAALRPLIKATILTDPLVALDAAATVAMPGTENNKPTK